MPSSSRSFSRQVLLSQLAVIVLVLALAAGTFAWLGARAVTDTNEKRALATARTLAEDPQLRQEVTAASDAQDLDAAELRDGPVQDQAMHVRERTGVQFVVVADDHGIRLSHPDPSLIGQLLSTSPERALAGQEDITRQTGTLGSTVRAKVPVYSSGDDGRVVGLVSVGIETSVLGEGIRREIIAVALVAAAALAVGALVSLALVRRLDRATMGVGPEELAEMARHQDAVLHGLDDGVLGFARGGQVTLANDRARRLLGWPPDAEDARGPVPSQIAAMVRRALCDTRSSASLGAPEHRRIQVDDQVLLTTAVAVRRGSLDVGAVVTLQDETQVLTMARQLESVTAMAQALRAQRHEFANRLHTVMGLVITGATREATSYMGRLLSTGPLAVPVPGIDTIEDPYLRALLEAKATIAAEAGVLLRVTPDSLVLGRASEPEDITLILGNLIDNALRAVVEAPRAPALAPAQDDPPDGDGVIEVQLLSAGTDLHGVVTDSGPGLDEDTDTAAIFTEGVTGHGDDDSSAAGGPRGLGTSPATEHPAHGHGIGLALCRRVAQRHGGRVWVLTAHDEHLGGAGFGVQLPGVLQTEEPEPVDAHDPRDRERS